MVTVAVIGVTIAWGLWAVGDTVDEYKLVDEVVVVQLLEYNSWLVMRCCCWYADKPYNPNGFDDVVLAAIYKNIIWIFIRQI